MTVPMFDRLMDSEGRKEDIALSYVAAMVDAMAEKAVEVAEEVGVNNIGLTGGVSYNNTITRLFEDSLRRRGRSIVLHDRTPNGDGGISVGQCAIALRSAYQ